MASSEAPRALVDAQRLGLIAQIADGIEAAGPLDGCRPPGNQPRHGHIGQGGDR